MAEALGDAVSLVGSRVALVAGPGVDNLFLSKVRKIVHSEDPFGLLVGAMTDAGLANIPSLACAVTERGGVRLIVRGAGRALVKTADGRSEVVSAKRVSTWSEHAFSKVEELVLVAPNAHGDQTSLVLFLDPADQRRAPRRARRTTPAAPPPEAPPSTDWAPPTEVTPRTPATAPPPPMAPAPPVPTFGTTATPPPLAREDDELELDFDHLVGQTQYRGVEAAAVRPPADEPTAFGDVDDLTTSHPLRTPVAFDEGDHDGNTVSLSELRDLTASTAVVGSAPRDTVVPTGPPVVGRLRFDDGQVVDVDRPIVLGRQPRSSSPLPDPGRAPRLVALADPGQALSRSHAEVRVEGGQVVVVDLGSTNGTTVTVAGRPPLELVPGVASPLGPGDHVTLADAVGFTFEPVGGPW